MLERQHHYAVRKNPDYDRRHAIQQVRRIPHHKRHFAAAELRQVNRPQKANRHAQQRSDQQHLCAAHNRIGHPAAGLSHRLRQLREEAPVDRRSTMIDKVSKNEEQNADSYQRAHPSHRQHEAAHELPPAQPRAHALAVPPPRCEVNTISSRASPFSKKVSRNSTRPSSISACKYKSPVASVNSFAITAAIEYPGESNEALIVGVFPMTIVTAIVSPRARARARNIDPIMPVRANGTTTFHVDSQRVAPKLSAASRWSRGTDINISRDTEIMYGITMMASTMPAVRNPTPYAGPENNGKNPSVFFSTGCT